MEREKCAIYAATHSGNLYFSRRGKEKSRRLQGTIDVVY